MKKSKLLLSIIPFFVAPALIGCQNANVKVIGICQLVTHPALDAATNGFMQAVKEGMGEKNVRFDLQDAAGEPGNCIIIANSFVSKNVDLIMANATPALQAVANSTTTIPVLGTSITEYGVALSIPNFNGVVGGNISGTSDLAPLDGQAEMIKELFPEAQKVGLLFCSAEANSLYQVNTVEALLQDEGIVTKRIAFADSNELQSVLVANVNDLDVLYIPTDNTAANNTSIIDAFVAQSVYQLWLVKKISPKRGVASLSIDYFRLGIKQKMAGSIKEGKTSLQCQLPTMKPLKSSTKKFVTN